MKVIRELRNQGYTDVQRKQLIQRVWHSWLPRKIAAMQWLTLAGGLPIGNWRAKANREGHCKLCGNPTEDTEHALMTCPKVSPAWTRFQALRQTSTRLYNYNFWQQILYGLCKPPGADSIWEGTAWDTARTTFVSSDTAWEILRSTLLWQIWVQKCNQELNGQDFSLDKALYLAWKTCIHVEMEVWRSIGKHKRNPDRVGHLVTLFSNIWTNEGIFRTMDAGQPRWTIIPPLIYLPQDLASQVPEPL